MVYSIICETLSISLVEVEIDEENSPASLRNTSKSLVEKQKKITCWLYLILIVAEKTEDVRKCEHLGF